jgi:zinc D-Ala-D-Ala dipeptidase
MWRILGSQQHRAAPRPRGVPLRSVQRPLCALLLLWPAAAPGAPAGPPPPPDLVDATSVAPDLAVEIKYATTDNFMHKNVYGEMTRCYLRKEAAHKLAAASKALRAMRPDLRLLAYDCARPVRVQQLMWKLVKGTPSQPYVADPKTGSMHNYGCAVDLTLADRKGRSLEMGSAFDVTGERAQPRQERALHLAGKLSAQHWTNRLLLRLVMVQAGFIPLDIEWWHFDCVRPGEARGRFTQLP